MESDKASTKIYDDEAINKLLNDGRYAKLDEKTSLVHQVKASIREPVKWNYKPTYEQKYLDDVEPDIEKPLSLNEQRIESLLSDQSTNTGKPFVYQPKALRSDYSLQNFTHTCYLDDETRKQEKYKLTDDHAEYKMPYNRGNLLLEYKETAPASRTLSSLYPQYRLPSDRSFQHYQDSRIVGSNFVMVQTRQPDSFYAKIDRLLKTARDTDPKYW